MATATDNPQLGMDEVLIEDAVVEQALARYQDAKDELVEPRKEMKRAKDAAMSALERLELPDGRAARVGRWRIERVDHDEAERSFTVPARTELKIRLIPEAE
jgi:hypothetical protein